MFTRVFVLLFGVFISVSCKLKIPSVDQVQFAEPTATPITPGQIDEASGIADSRSQPGNLWVQEDSGNPAELALLGHNGQLKGRIAVPRFTNEDWEDMAIGPGPNNGTNYIYLADIGDNNAQRVLVQIYRLPEPANLQTPITQIERMNFRYPDGPRDAEAMFVDPQTRDIYVISKREPNVRLYRLAYPQNINEVLVAEALGEMPSLGGGGLPNFVTGAAISPDGTEILVRTYTNTYYWKRSAGQSVADALQKGNVRTLTTRLEPQGEAICFDRDGRGYFTLSERANAASVSLLYYAKK